MKKIIGIGVILKTPQNTYLFQERDNNTKLHPGGIAAFGGGIEGEENVYDCAKRELFEELGFNVDVKNLETIGHFPTRHQPDVYIQMFLTKEVDLSTLKLQEGRSIVELSKTDALQHQKVTDFTKEVLNTL